jgi:hypothetical protein
MLYNKYYMAAIVGQWDKTFIHAGQQGDECAITSLEAVFCLFLRVTMTLPAYLIKQVQINFVHSTLASS